MGFQPGQSSLVYLISPGHHRPQEMCFYKIHEYLFVSTGALSVAVLHGTIPLFLNMHKFIGLSSLTYVNAKHADTEKCSDQQPQ